MPITTPILDFPLDSCGAHLSVCPLPSPFPRTTVLCAVLYAEVINPYVFRHLECDTSIEFYTVTHGDGGWGQEVEGGWGGCSSFSDK